MMRSEVFGVQILEELLGWDCDFDSICHPPFVLAEEIEDRYRDLRYKGVSH